MAHISKSAKGNKKLIIILLLTGFVTLISLLWEWLLPDDQPLLFSGESTLTMSSNMKSQTLPSQTTQETNELIPVYLVGAVQRPGIYLVDRGSYLYQLVEKAGGLTPDAAREFINLALKLDHNQLIRLPTQAEAASSPNAWAQSIDQTENSTLDLNQADLKQLDELPGIGPSTARAIIDYRNKKGPFQKIEDLMKIPGIKESRFNALKDFVSVTDCS